MTTPTSKVPLHWRLVGFVAVFLGCLALALSWKWGPLQDWLDIPRGIVWLRQWGSDISPLMAIGGFALACILVMPITFQMLIAVTTFGPGTGLTYVLAGGAIGAAVSFGIGRWLGADAMRRLAGDRANRISESLGRRGIATTFVIRLFPMAPFALINMMAGLSHLRLRDFLIGSTLGLLPAGLVIATSVDAVMTAISQPDSSSGLFVGALAVILLAGFWLMRIMLRRLLRRSSSPDSSI